MLVLAEIFGLGPMELVLIAVIILVFFGAAKIPQLARSLGKAKGEFEKGAREGRDEALKGQPETEEEKVRRAAREMGIATEGRSLDDIKRDVRAKMS